jgi:hypothetical protein
MDRLIVATETTLKDRAGGAITSNDAGVILSSLGRGSITLVNDEGYGYNSAQFLTPVALAPTSPNTLWRFACGQEGKEPNVSHDINPYRFKWTRSDYAAGLKHIGTWTITPVAIPSANGLAKYAFALNAVISDLRTTGYKETIDQRISLRHSFYWSGTTGTTAQIAELHKEVQGFAKKLNALSKGRFVITTSASATTVTITSTALEYNVIVRMHPDSLIQPAGTVVPTTNWVAATSYAEGLYESAKQLEYRVSPSYGHNPVLPDGIEAEDDVWSKVSDLVPGTGYTTYVIQSGNPAPHNLFVNDNAGLIGTQYILVPSGSAATITFINKALELIKGVTVSTTIHKAGLV